MATGWDFDTNNSGGGGEKQEFTKFPVGITKLRFLDVAPNVRWMHWMDQFQRSINCPGRGCPICTMRKQQKANNIPYTYKMSRRFAMNNYNHETNRPEIMEQGITFFEDLRDIMTDLGETGKKLIDVVIKVRRRGTGQDDTSYRIDVDRHEELSVEEKTALAEKTDLDEYFKAHTPEQILAVLNVQATTKDEFLEKWNAIMNPEEVTVADDQDENDGDIGTEEDIEIS